MTPGEGERAQVELEAARQAVRAARVLIDASGLRDAVSRLYYSVFHATRAALLVRGLHAKTHSGQITTYEQTFGKDPLLGQLFRLRGEADYGFEFDIASDEVVEIAERVEAFIASCDEIVAKHIAEGPDAPDPAPDI